MLVKDVAVLLSIDSEDTFIERHVCLAWKGRIT